MTHLTGMLIKAKYNGNLDEMAENLTIEDKLEAMRQLLNGLIKLHEISRIHRDILLKNIFVRIKVKEEKKIKYYHLGDFGISVIFNPEEHSKSLVNKDICSLGDAFETMFFKGLDMYDKPISKDFLSKVKEWIYKVKENRQDLTLEQQVKREKQLLDELALIKI